MRSEDSIKEKIADFQNFSKELEDDKNWDPKTKNLVMAHNRDKITLLNWVLEKED